MSDLLIDFSPARGEHSVAAADHFRFFPDIAVSKYAFGPFDLVVSREDDWTYWGPSATSDETIFAAMAGRIAFDRPLWDRHISRSGYHGLKGGIASSAIASIYLDEGIKGLERLNGAFVVVLYDREKKKVFLITDRCGMYPLFQVRAAGGGCIYGTHPDVLAAVAESSGDIDPTSLAEFLITGKVSFPHTYYKNITGLEPGSVHTIDLKGNGEGKARSEKYFELTFHFDPGASEWDLAEELAGAFRNAVSRRTDRRFGRSAISLSGGLDSRALLCAAPQEDNVRTFCFFDEENLEYRVAKAIAKEVGVLLIPMRRTYDHYGDNAEPGIRISGGMGDFGNNHFLGFRSIFRESGIENVLAGFYCDYFFKGLLLDRDKNRLLGAYRLSGFRHETYMPLLWFDTPYAGDVRERLYSQMPGDIREDNTEVGFLAREAKRLFPLSMEPDNMETTVPMRTIGWYLPIVDNDIVDTYLKIPARHKVNGTMYSKMVYRLCGKAVSNIINVNTGARVNAPAAAVLFHKYSRFVRKKITKESAGMKTEESWPNWDYYLHNSEKIKTLWSDPEPETRELITCIVGKDPWRMPIRNNTDVDLKCFLRILTMKIWLERRIPAN
jgi:asparagine synthase (glutamine-hydrolysing)